MRATEGIRYAFPATLAEALELQRDEATRGGPLGGGTDLMAQWAAGVPVPERKRREVRFTVQSLRFDAVLGETFRLSRTQATKLIALGAASLNYLPCLKNDAPVSEGDVISLKGHGKATVAEVGGQSRKGRLFITAEVWI